MGLCGSQLQGTVCHDWGVRSTRQLVTLHLQPGHKGSWTLAMERKLSPFDAVQDPSRGTSRSLPVLGKVLRTPTPRLAQNLVSQAILDLVKPSITINPHKESAL